MLGGRGGFNLRGRGLVLQRGPSAVANTVHYGILRTLARFTSSVSACFFGRVFAIHPGSKVRVQQFHSPRLRSFAADLVAGLRPYCHAQLSRRSCAGCPTACLSFACQVYHARGTQLLDKQFVAHDMSAAEEDPQNWQHGQYRTQATRKCNRLRRGEAPGLQKLRRLRSRYVASDKGRSVYLEVHG